MLHVASCWRCNCWWSVYIAHFLAVCIITTGVPIFYHLNMGHKLNYIFVVNMKACSKWRVEFVKMNEVGNETLSFGWALHDSFIFWMRCCGPVRRLSRNLNFVSFNNFFENFQLALVSQCVNVAWCTTVRVLYSSQQVHKYSDKNQQFYAEKMFTVDFE